MTNSVTISKYLENILLVVPVFILPSVFYDKFSYVVFIRRHFHYLSLHLHFEKKLNYLTDI